MKTKSAKPTAFFSSQVVLTLLGICLVGGSIYLWKAQEAANLEHLQAQTQANAVWLSSEAEIRYQGVSNALNRLANKGKLDNAPKKYEWEKDASFFIVSFPGLQSIAWVDKRFVIQMIAPLEAHEGSLNQKANDILPSPNEVNIWVSVYTGNELEGFVLGVLDLNRFIAPLLDQELEQNYALQLLDEGKSVFTSKNWPNHRPQDEVRQTINLQNSVSLSLLFAPTQQYLQAKAADARPTLLLSLLFSLLMLSAVYFAQNYQALARLNEARYRELLEDVQLMAVTLDLQGRVTFCNDYLLTLTNWKREEVLGQDWFERFGSSNWEELKQITLTRALSGDLPAYAENPIRTRSGEQRWVKFNNTILRNTKNEIIGLASLGEDVTDRRLAEANIHELNVELEARVRERTRQLEAANHELEAFSYSVSHDLRAPLRGIDGWSLALLEDYGSRLDEQAKTYLQRVRSETQRMGQLIDDLLDLSRLTRSEMVLARVDMSAMAQTITANLIEAGPNREVVFVIQPGLNANGDARLLEIVLTNLFDNALKFTSKIPQARIEFGQTEIESQRAFFVRDNGAGFDMAFSKKLFGVFQRMHRASEFPGTGVGLTTVQRIIHRHGGRIWANAAVNQGATFYFTLEES